MRLLVINNKNSGQGDNAIFDFLRVLGAEGDEFVVRYLAEFSDLPNILADATDFDVVVVAAGDGTVAAICYELKYKNVPVVPFPAGTSNLLSLNLSHPEEPRAIAKMVRKGNLQKYDLCELGYTTDTGQEVCVGFDIMAGAGYDAMIMNGATKLKRTLGQRAYYLSALLSEKPKKAEIQLTIDGKKYTTSGIGVLLVNFGKIASGMSVTHVNDAQDGLIEVVVLKVGAKHELMPTLIAAFLDKRGQYPQRGPQLEIYAGEHVEVETNPLLPIQFDGELAGAHTPMWARALPGALTTIVDDEELMRLDTLRMLENEGF